MEIYPITTFMRFYSYFYYFYKLEQVPQRSGQPAHQATSPYESPCHIVLAGNRKKRKKKVKRKEEREEAHDQSAHSYLFYDSLESSSSPPSSCVPRLLRHADPTPAALFACSVQGPVSSDLLPATGFLSATAAGGGASVSCSRICCRPPVYCLLRPQATELPSAARPHCAAFGSPPLNLYTCVPAWAPPLRPAASCLSGMVAAGYVH